jgi:hypothetical protein
MFPAAQLLYLVIIAAPATLIFDGPIAQGFVVALAAFVMAVVAMRLRAGEVDFFASVLTPLTVIAAIPALCMLVQVLPLNFIGIANPIWKSAAGALGHDLKGGGISIDPGATLVTFARYCSLVAIAFTAAAVAIDRYRAEKVLFSIVISTTFIAGLMLSKRFGYVAFPTEHSNPEIAEAANNCAALGLTISAAAVLHLLARGPSKQDGSAASAGLFFMGLLALVGAFAICGVAVIASAQNSIYFAAACGIATFAVAIFARRFQLGIWGYLGILAAIMVIATAVVAVELKDAKTDFTLVFATKTPLTALTQRILAETNWAGTGAGTFAAVLPIYGEVEELAQQPIAPTAAAGIAVEMGPPFLWAMIVAAITLIVLFLRGAARRGRDLFHPAVGASCLVTFGLLAFANTGLFNTAAAVVAAAALGLATAQSKGRTL